MTFLELGFHAFFFLHVKIRELSRAYCQTFVFTIIAVDAPCNNYPSLVGLYGRILTSVVHDLGQDSPIQTSCSVIKSYVIVYVSLSVQC